MGCHTHSPCPTGAQLLPGYSLTCGQNHSRGPHPPNRKAILAAVAQTEEAGHKKLNIYARQVSLANFVAMDSPEKHKNGLAGSEREHIL